jgi:hypothetical protein
MTLVPSPLANGEEFVFGCHLFETVLHETSYIYVPRPLLLWLILERRLILFCHIFSFSSQFNAVQNL